MLLVFLFLIPLGWGWGYRGWDPPRPGYWRRRAYAQEVAGWGILADILWLVFIMLAVWLIVAAVA